MRRNNQVTRIDSGPISKKSAGPSSCTRSSERNSTMWRDSHHTGPLYHCDRPIHGRACWSSFHTSRRRSLACHPDSIPSSCRANTTFLEAGIRDPARWWAQLVGARRVHPHKYCADYAEKKNRGNASNPVRRRHEWESALVISTWERSRARWLRHRRSGITATTPLHLLRDRRV